MTEDRKELTDEDKRYLTEFLEECWHENEEHGGRFGGYYKCKKCEEIGKTNRTFTLPQDSADVVKRLKELGEWEGFFSYLIGEGHLMMRGYSFKLFDLCFTPTLFCEKVTEFLRERKNNASW